ncbi:MAG: hypothetical protein IPK97_04050 [Ahniella sp.]|nr:hypothetical protein [Ahniella sp.]
MSQILDALKRSEAARAQSTETPVTLAPVWRTARRRPLWPLWLGLVVMSVLAAGVWQNRSELWPERFAQPEEESSRQTSPEPVAKPKPAPADPVAAVPPPEVSEPNPAEAIQPDPAAPAEIAELAPTAPPRQ